MPELSLGLVNGTKRLFSKAQEVMCAYSIKVKCTVIPSLLIISHILSVMGVAKEQH